MSIPAAFLVVMMVACNGDPTQPDRVANDKPFELRVGDAALTTDDLRMRFDAVRSDSRCPSDALCVWAGEAVIALTLSRAGEAASGASSRTRARNRQRRT